MPALPPAPHGGEFTTSPFPAYANEGCTTETAAGPAATPARRARRPPESGPPWTARSDTAIRTGGRADRRAGPVTERADLFVCE